jgi:hypothetical protein
MNMMRMALRMRLSGNVYIFVFFILISLFHGCSVPDKKAGFVLNEFSIDDGKLKSIIDSMTASHLQILQSNIDKKIMTLNLSRKDTALLFIFSIRNENDLIYKYIFRNNKRVVGYTISSNVEVILLSDIDDLAELGNCYGRFIHPIRNFKKFDYMIFPESLYIGRDHNAWPDFELVYDPTYIVYPYVNGKFLSPFMTTNPYTSESGVFNASFSKK